jgi:hypothetical protein
MDIVAGWLIDIVSKKDGQNDELNEDRRKQILYEFHDSSRRPYRDE